MSRPMVSARSRSRTVAVLAAGAALMPASATLGTSALPATASTQTTRHSLAETAFLSSTYTVQQAAPTFADPAFQRLWARTDSPVASGQVARSWFWGPTPGSGPLQEDYAEGLGGKRLVQYFDKSRMEINNPTADRNSPFYVTNGLLTVELISGKMQTGNSTYVDRWPADIPLASDNDDANAPTYYSFQNVSNTPLGDHPASARTGQPATATISRSGSVGDDPTKSTYPRVNIVYYDQTTRHNVPQAIWEFLNESGPVFDSATGKTVDARLSDPWFYATGLPVSEPYWARVKVAGQMQDVLIQAFERRVVTYTPNGVPGFKVQMGNIGRHYYDWRYNDAGRPQGTLPARPTATPIGGPGPGPGPAPTPSLPPAPPTPVAPDCSGVPPSRDATVEPLCGPIGTEFEIEIRGFSPGERVSLWITLPTGEVAGTEEPLDAGPHNGTLYDYFDSSILEGINGLEGIWYITYQGEQSAHQSVAYFMITPSGPPAGTTPTPSPTTDPNLSTCSDVPASVNMTITPGNCARIGTRFIFVGSGFQPGEQVGVYVTAPDQSVYGAPLQINANADGRSDPQAFNSASGLPYGVWALTMEGTVSHNRAIGYFKLIP